MFPQKETRKKAVAEAAKATRTRAFMGKNDTRVIGYDGQAKSNHITKSQDPFEFVARVLTGFLIEKILHY